MTLIDQINESISSMSDDELFERIKELRAARRVPTPIGKPKKSAKSASNLDLNALLAAMTPDEIASLINELED